MNKILFAVPLALLLGCYGDRRSKLLVDESRAEFLATSAPVDRKLIKNGFIEFTTSDLGVSKKQILEAVTRYNAYINSDQESKTEDVVSNSLVIRVPALNFDNLLADATKGVDAFDSRQISTTDVTEEYIDVIARIKTKTELESRYFELLKQAKTVTEMLEIEKQLSEVRTEIESNQGRLKYLESQVTFSTLTITMKKYSLGSSAFGTKLWAGLVNGWDYLILFLLGLVNIWPFLILSGGAYAIYRYKFAKPKQS